MTLHKDVVLRLVVLRDQRPESGTSLLVPPERIFQNTVYPPVCCQLCPHTLPFLPAPTFDLDVNSCHEPPRIAT